MEAVPAFAGKLESMKKRSQNPPQIRVPESSHPRVVIVGGGFGGIALARSLSGAPYQVVLFDQNNFHQFQPLLYQVATCGLSADGISFPLRKILEEIPNARFRMARVESVDPESRLVRTDSGEIGYDHLVLASGSVSNFFGNDEIERHGIGLKSITDSLALRSRLLKNLEAATLTTNNAEREALTNLVIVGGGPAGVETAGALAEFRSHILERDYPDLVVELMKIYLIQSGDRLLKGMSDKASLNALRELRKMGVEVVLDNRVQSFDGRTVTTKTGLEIQARTLCWTAGVRGECPGGIPENTFAGGGRLAVDPHLAVTGLESVYAVGDLACQVSDEFPYGHPMVAPAAIQQGRLVGKNLKALAAGKPLQAFDYHDKGSLATIGMRRAVADFGDWKFTGFPAWVLWSLVHIATLAGFRNKLFTFLTWAMSYFSYEKGNRFVQRN